MNNDQRKSFTVKHTTVLGCLTKAEVNVIKMWVAGYGYIVLNKKHDT